MRTANVCLLLLVALCAIITAEAGSPPRVINCGWLRGRARKTCIRIALRNGYKYRCMLVRSGNRVRKFCRFFRSVRRTRSYGTYWTLCRNVMRGRKYRKECWRMRCYPSICKGKRVTKCIHLGVVHRRGRVNRRRIRVRRRVNRRRRVRRTRRKWSYRTRCYTIRRNGRRIRRCWRVRVWSRRRRVRRKRRRRPIRWRCGYVKSRYGGFRRRCRFI